MEAQLKAKTVLTESESNVLPLLEDFACSLVAWQLFAHSKCENSEIVMTMTFFVPPFACSMQECHEFFFFSEMQCSALCWCNQEAQRKRNAHSFESEREGGTEFVA